jgi:hypothetical protein
MSDEKVNDKGYRSVSLDSVAPGYKKPGCMSDYMKSGTDENRGGGSVMSRPDPYSGEKK